MEPQRPTAAVKVAYCAIWVVVLAYSAGCYYLMLDLGPSWAQKRHSK